MKKSFKQYAMATRQKGFTLIEMAIVLMIIGVLAMASIYGFGVYRTTKNESTARNINTVATAIQGKWKFDAATSGVSATAVTNAGIATAAQLASLSVTTITGTSTATAGTYDAFTIAVTPVNAATCADVLRNTANNIVGMSTGASPAAGAAVAGSFGVAATSPSTVAGTAIDAACNTAGVTQVNLSYAKNPS
jgi:prepilin-type N-terminal cleavage/methylation domain-containing protein